MSQDIISDSLNQLMNAKRVGKKEVVLQRYSKVLLSVLEIMKQKGAIDYTLNEEEKVLKIKILKLNECRSVKPRYYSGYQSINKYLRRFLPSRNLGSLIISTNQGMLTHQEAIANKVGGSLIAYFY
ncbi:30S ribosomal protein S8 [Candidatus Pacearchaeota archaeon]|nr:30S ribosomal protein S8 [Candidatus Pacearchaeota archaeon]|tara:strand:+ start:29361 stop:29738 length:378 start_codon:yes stop_codon:yes gene_type:complete